MDRTSASRYVQCFRVKQGFSVDYLASRVKLPMVDYIKIEEAPHKVPVSRLLKIFDALLMTTQDRIDFQIIAHSAVLERKAEIE